MATTPANTSLSPTPYPASDWVPYVGRLETTVATNPIVLSGAFNGVAPALTVAGSPASSYAYEANWDPTGTDPVTGAVTGCFWLTPLGAGTASGYIKITPNQLENNIYGSSGIYYVYSNKSANATVTPIDGGASNDVYGAVVRDFAVGFNAGFYDEHGASLNPQISGDTFNLSLESNWTLSSAFGQNVDNPTPGYQYYNPYSGTISANSNAYGFNYSDGLDSINDYTPQIPVADSSGNDFASVDLTVFAPNDPALTGYTTANYNNYIAANPLYPDDPNQAYQAADQPGSNTLTFSFSSLVNGAFQQVDIAKTDTITLYYLKSDTGGSPQWGQILLNGNTVGGMGLWQTWTVTGSAAHGYSAAASYGGESAGNLIIQNLPVPAGNGNTWYQIEVSNDVYTKFYNLYTTTSSGDITDEAIDGRATITPAVGVANTFSVNFGASQSYGTQLSVLEPNGAAGPSPAQTIYPGQGGQGNDTLANLMQEFNNGYLNTNTVQDPTYVSVTPGFYSMDLQGQAATGDPTLGVLEDSNPLAGATLMISDGTIQDVSGSLPTSVVMDGAGTLILTNGVNGVVSQVYSGPTTIASGTLEIQSGGSAGGGGTWIAAGAHEIVAAGGSAGTGQSGQSAPTITFGGAGATLELDEPVASGTPAAFANTLNDFVVGDTLDLAGLPAAFDSTATVSDGALTVKTGHGNYAESFTLGGASATAVTLSTDGRGGLLVTGASAGSNLTTKTLTVYNEAQIDAAIASANAATSGAYTISFGGLIAESAAAPLAFKLNSNVTVTLNGGGYALDGGLLQSGLTVTSGAVTIANLTIQNAVDATGQSDGSALDLAGGANVTLDNVSFSNDSASDPGGYVHVPASAVLSISGGNLPQAAGGGAILIDGTEPVTLGAGEMAGETTYVSGGIAEQNGAGRLVIVGLGTVVLSGANAYSGGTTIQSGALALEGLTAAGTGAITFAPAAPAACATLEIGLGDEPTNVIAGFGAGDVIDLGGAPYESGDYVTIAGSTVAIMTTSSPDPIASFTMQGSYAPSDFEVSPDKAGTGLELTGGPFESVAAYMANPRSGWVIQDTADDVARSDVDTLNTYEQSHFAPILLTDSGAPNLGLTSEQQSQDTYALGAITNKLFTVTAAGVTTYYAGGNGNSGEPGTEIDVAATGSPVQCRAASNLSLTGAKNTVTAGDNSLISAQGGLNAFALGSGETVVLSGTTTGTATDGLDVVKYANSDTITLENASGTDSGAQAAISGGGNKVYLYGASGNPNGGSLGNAAILCDTTSGWDAVYGNYGSVGLNNAQATIMGGAVSVYTDNSSSDVASLFNTGSMGTDYVQGNYATIGLNNAQAAIVGGGNSVHLDGSPFDAAALSNTNFTWDAVYGNAGQVSLSNAQATIQGGGDTVTLDGSSSNAAGLFDTGGFWDAVNGNSGFVSLNNAQAAISGSGVTITLDGSSSNAAALSNTSGIQDSVKGDFGFISLTSAQADITGDGDTIDLYGSGDIVNLSAITSGAGPIYDETALGGSSTIQIGSNVGALKIYTFDNDPNGVINLLNGAGGYSSPAAAYSALQNDGSGGSLLSLGASGSIDFANVASTFLSAANFKIG